MIEGTLYASTVPGHYAIGGPEQQDISRGQSVELFLGGQWIPGSIAYSEYHTDPADDNRADTLAQTTGAYYMQQDDVDDMVTEASEESFPASDPPSWTDDADSTPKHAATLLNGYYFVADADNSVCGLCIGTRIRIPSQQILP